MHSCHQAFGNAERIVHDFGQGGQAVGGAAGVGENVHIRGDGLVVDAHDEHGGIILGRRGHNNLFRAGFKVGFGFFLSQENTGGFHNIVSAYGIPFESGGIFFAGNPNFFAVNNKVFAFYLNIAFELAVDGIIFEHVGQIFGVEQIVHAHNFDIRATLGSAENKTTYASEPVDADFYFRHSISFWLCLPRCAEQAGYMAAITDPRTIRWFPLHTLFFSFPQAAGMPPTASARKVMRPEDIIFFIALQEGK